MHPLKNDSLLYVVTATRADDFGLLGLTRIGLALAHSGGTAPIVWVVVADAVYARDEDQKKPMALRDILEDASAGASHLDLPRPGPAAREPDRSRRGGASP